MSSAIEILKKIFETNKSVMFEDEKDALKKGILALEQKERLQRFISNTKMNNNLLRCSINHDSFKEVFLKGQEKLLEELKIEGVEK